jgi:hypothetical protein
MFKFWPWALVGTIIVSLFSTFLFSYIFDKTFISQINTKMCFIYLMVYLALMFIYSFYRLWKEY